MQSLIIPQAYLELMSSHHPPASASQVSRTPGAVTFVPDFLFHFFYCLSPGISLTSLHFFRQYVPVCPSLPARTLSEWLCETCEHLHPWLQGVLSVGVYIHIHVCMHTHTQTCTHTHEHACTKETHIFMCLSVHIHAHGSHHTCCSPGRSLAFTNRALTVA